VSVQQPEAKRGDSFERSLEQPYERAKLPMVIAAVVMVAGLAISGSLDKTPSRAGDPGPSVPFGGAVVLAAWVLGIGAIHRLGRAGSMDRSENRARPPASVVDPPPPAPSASGRVDEDEDEDEDGEEPDDRKSDESKPKPD
jgi:hypothetical protein